MNNKLLCCVTIIGLCCSSILASPAGQHNYYYDVPHYGLPPQFAYQQSDPAAQPQPLHLEPIYYGAPTQRAQEPHCEFYESGSLSAIAVLKSGAVEGNVTLTQKSCSDPLLVDVRIIGLTPGPHGFHVHEKGDLSGGCGSTGGHYNPDKLEHGDIKDVIRHAGDWANVVANEQGLVQVQFTDTVASLYGPKSIIGRAIVVHEGEDDLGKGGHADSKKTGNAGGRAACGVIGILDPVDADWTCSSSVSLIPSVFSMIALFLLNKTLL